VKSKIEKQLEKITKALEALSLPKQQLTQLKKYQQKLAELNQFIVDNDYVGTPDIMIKATETYLHYLKKTEYNFNLSLNFLNMKFENLGWKNEGLNRRETEMSALLDNVDELKLKYETLYASVNISYASALLHQGDFEHCIDVLNKVNEQYKITDNVDATFSELNIIANMHNNYGLAYRAINNTIKARVHLKKSFEILCLYKIDNTFDAPKIAVLMNIAAIYEKENATEKAIQILKENYNIVKCILNNDAHVYSLFLGCQYLLMLSKCAGDIYDIKTQKLSLKKVEKMLPKVKDHFEEVNANYLFKKSSLLINENKFSEALMCIQTAFIEVFSNFTSKDFYDTPQLQVEDYKKNQFYILQPFSLKFKCLLKYYENEQTDNLDLLELCLDVVDKVTAYFETMRKSYKGQHSKFSIGEYSTIAGDVAQKACWHLYSKTNNQKYADKAFEYANNSKALVLLEEMNQKWFKNKNINISIKKMQSCLQSNEILVDYNIGDSGIFIYTAEKNKAIQFYFIDKEKTKLTKQAINNWLMYHFNIFKTTTYLSFQKESFDIYKVLLEPFLNKKKKAIILSPGDFLNNVPFEALAIIGQNKPNNYNDIHYLIDKYTISYTFSSYFFCLNRGKKNTRKTAPKHLIVAPNFLNDKTLAKHNTLKVSQQKLIAEESLTTMNYQSESQILNYNKNIDFSFLEDDQQVLISKEKLWNLINNTSQKTKPASLIYNAEIIDKIITTLNSKENLVKVLENKLATLNKVLKNLKNLEVLLISSHAETEKGILLYDEDGEETYLNYEDLRNKNINANIAILNMCDSGLGKKIIGEGYLSLGRALFSSGCLNVVQTLYKVSDKHSAIIIENFFKQLQNKNTNYAIALRKAKLKVRKAEKSHPKFWAGHVIYGSNNKL